MCHCPNDNNNWIIVWYHVIHLNNFCGAKWSAWKNNTSSCWGFDNPTFTTWNTKYEISRWNNLPYFLQPVGIYCVTGFLITFSNLCGPLDAWILSLCSNCTIQRKTIGFYNNTTLVSKFHYRIDKFNPVKTHWSESCLVTL